MPPRTRRRWTSSWRGGHAYEDEGAIRVRVPDEGEAVIQDVIRGEVRFPLQSIQDFVVRRSDGSPLYNLAVAVDDRDMGVTHVIRGDDHLSNTPRQALILDALGAERPVYAHLPLLYGPDGKKLSKRHGAASVQELRAAGYLPEAVRNYIALLGWGDEESSTILSTDELVKRFDLTRVSKSPAVFDEQKLRWMNGRYMRELPVEDLRARLEETLGRDDTGRGGGHQPGEDADAVRLLAAVRRSWWSPRRWTRRPGQRSWGTAPASALLAARRALEDVEPFDAGGVETALRGVVDALEAKPRDVFQPVRVAISGTTVSPGIFESVAVLGREETLARMDRALERAGAGR